MSSIEVQEDNSDNGVFLPSRIMAGYRVQTPSRRFEQKFILIYISSRSVCRICNMRASQGQSVGR